MRKCCLGVLTPRISEKDGPIWLDIGECVEDVSQLFTWEIGWVVISCIDGPVDEVGDAFEWFLGHDGAGSLIDTGGLGVKMCLIWPRMVWSHRFCSG